MSTSVTRSEKLLSCNTNFRPFLRLNSSNFNIKPCKKPWPYSYQNCQMKLSSKGPGPSYNEEKVSGDNQPKNIAY